MAVVALVFMSMSVGTLSALVPVKPTVSASKRVMGGVTGSGPAKLAEEQIVLDQPHAIWDGEVEYIFHPEPRVRTKYQAWEIEVELVGAKGWAKANPQRATQRGGTYQFERVFADTDVIYRIGQNTLTEEMVMARYHSFEALEYDLFVTGLTPLVVGNGEMAFVSSSSQKQVFAWQAPYMYEQDHPEEKSVGLEYVLKKQGLGYRVEKRLTAQGQVWLADPGRRYPVVIDPTQVSVIQTGIINGEAPFGSPARGIAFFPNATADDCDGTAPVGCWYAIYMDTSDVMVEKCPAYLVCDATGDWTLVSNTIDADADTDNFNATVAKDGDYLHMLWYDNSLDGFQTARMSTIVDAETVDEVCTSTDLGTIGTNAGSMSIAVADDGDKFIAMVEQSATTPLVTISQVTSGCSITDITTNSGVDDTDRVELLTIGNDLFVINAADNGLRASIYVDDGTPGWDTQDQDVNGATADNTTIDMSAATDGTDIWVIQRSGTSGDSESFQCVACGTSSPTWTALTEPWGSGLSTASYIGFTYISGSNQVVAMMMEGAGTSERVLAKVSDADSIAYGSQIVVGFTSGASGLDVMTVTANVASIDQVGIVQREATNNEYEFSTVPENVWLLALTLPWLPKILRKLRRNEL